MNVRNFASTDLPLVDVFVWSKYVTRKSGFIDLFTFLCVGALLVLSAYAAPATESRSELVGQKANENDDLDDEDEAIEKRRFRGVKRSFADVEDSEEKLEKRGGGSGHQKERDVEPLAFGGMRREVRLRQPQQAKGRACVGLGEVDEGPRKLDQPLVKSREVALGPQPKFLEDVVGFKVEPPVETLEEAGVAWIVARRGQCAQEHRDLP